MRKITDEETINNVCDMCALNYEQHKISEHFVHENCEDELTARLQLREFYETFAITNAPMKYDCHRNGNNEYCVEKIKALKQFVKYDKEEDENNYSLFKE